MARAQELLTEAVAAEGEAWRALMAGADDGASAARPALERAARAYRASWEAAGPRSFGRLVGLMKVAILTHGHAAARDAAGYVREQLPGEPDSETAAYALALAALALGDDAAARRLAPAVEGGGEAFARVGAAIGSLASADPDRYARALDAILDDFAARPAHLTGVRIADTAAMLEALAEPRGLAVHPVSDLLPAAP